MVNVQVVVQDSKGHYLEGIPIDIFVHSCNILGGLSNNYHVYGITNNSGQYILSNAQGYCQFTITANYKNSENYQKQYSTETANTSTTDTSGGYVDIVLQSIVQPKPCGSSCKNPNQLVCPNGYTLVNDTCIENSQPKTILSLNPIEIITVVIIIIIIAITIWKLRGNKK